jgi:hypothetical protein
MQVAAPVCPIIEFIGNSITTGDGTTSSDVSAFPWLTREALSCDHTQIFYNGITLVNGYYLTYAGAPTVGMSVSFFKQRTPPKYPSTDNFPKWIYALLLNGNHGAGMPCLHPLRTLSLP